MEIIAAPNRAAALLLRDIFRDITGNAGAFPFDPHPCGKAELPVKVENLPPFPLSPGIVKADPFTVTKAVEMHGPIFVQFDETV